MLLYIRMQVMDIPSHQYAVQLIGPDRLELNKNKDVTEPGDHQILARVEAVGLCFSDLKLLKQFSEHARKSDVLEGIDPAVLPEIPSYCPNERPTVPGHEAVAVIVSVAYWILPDCILPYFDLFQCPGNGYY